MYEDTPSWEAAAGMLEMTATTPPGCRERAAPCLVSRGSTAADLLLQQDNAAQMGCTMRQTQRQSHRFCAHLNTSPQVSAVSSSSG
jgi:hypothetical protein